MSEFTNIFEDGEVVGYNPDQDGDFFKITDYKRDFEYNQEQIARAIKALSSSPTEDFMILYGGVVTDSGSGQVDISAGVAIGQDAEGDVRFIILPAQSNVPMPTGWDDGRQIWVVGRHDWKLGSSTRNHKQTVTSYHYTVEDSYLGETDTDDLFVDADPTGSYVIWGSFTMTGTTFADQSERSSEWSANKAQWNLDSNTWTYSSADAPTYIFNVDADATGYLFEGQKIKYYQDSTWRYGIITAVGAYSGGNTPITIYGGGNTSSPSYAMSSSAITYPYFAATSRPFDFPLNPDTWSYEYVDDTARTQSSPSDATWYNPGSTSVDIPIGLWKIQYKVHLYGHHNNPGDDTAGAQVTLSTANNSESDKDFTGYILYDASGIPTNINSFGGMVSTNGIIDISSKTTYYLNVYAVTGSGFDTLGFLNNQARLVIKAVCEYL